MHLESPAVAVKAGPHRVSAAFLQRFESPVDDLMAPIEHTLADTTIGTDYGIKTLPHLREFRINGPHNVTGISETVSRRKIFTCRPTSAEDARPCAQQIVSQLAAKAYRRPLNEMDLEGLMSFYETGAAEGDFESGVRTALQAILTSPHFVFRIEEAPDAIEPMEDGGIHRLNDLELASRLSFFLWATVPDEELVKLGSQGLLSDPAVVERQLERMLADPRSEALATRFASQWLRLQDLEKIDPDYLFHPLYDDTLASALKSETERFFENLVREDRSVLEILTADYTFVNERLARHHRIPNKTRIEIPPGEVPPPPPPEGAPSRRHDGPGARESSLGPRGDGASPLDPGVLLLPPGHRPSRSRARELRRDRSLAHQGQWRSRRRLGRALRRHASRRSFRPPAGAAEISGRFRHELHRKSHDLRTRPESRVL